MVTKPFINSRESWGAHLPRSEPHRRLGLIDFTYLHHTPRNHEYTEPHAPRKILGIQEYHMFSNGWSDIGYHFLVDKYGNIFEGREIDIIGAHAKGHNTRSIGVAFLGDGDRSTGAAQLSIAHLYLWLEEYLGKHLHRRSHRDTRDTYCPGDVMDEWWKGFSRDDYQIVIVPGIEMEDDEMIGPGAEEEIGHNAVTWWQWQISNYLYDDRNAGHVTGKYDNETVQEVKKIQKSFKFKQTGVLDATTRFRMILHNMEGRYAKK